MGAKIYRIILMVISIMMSMESLAQGFDENYEVLSGDFNGDGILDLYVKQKPQVVLIHGDIITPIVLKPDVKEFVLVQQADHSFIINSNLTSAQELLVSSWVNADVKLIVDDFNIDDTSDVLLKGVNNVIPEVSDQLVFSSTQKHSSPVAVNAIDTQVRQFFEEVNGWLLDEYYFENTALEKGWYQVEEGQTMVAWWRVGYLMAWNYTASDGTPFFDDYGDIDNPLEQPYGCSILYSCNFISGEWYIYTEATEYTLNIDYSNFNQDSIDFKDALSDSITSGTLEIIAQSIETLIIEEILERVLGVEVYGGILGDGGRLDIEVGVGAGDLDGARGSVILGYISLLSSVTQPVHTTQPKHWRLLTAGEKALATANGIVVNDIDGVRVYNKSYWMLQGQISAPNGHIYVGQPNSNNLPWSQDYSINTVRENSIIVHEMVHLYQNRTLGWSTVKMISKGAAAFGQYCFTITSGKAYEDYNMEQQAQMVQERHLLTNGSTNWLSCHAGVTVQQLNQVIPF